MCLTGMELTLQTTLALNSRSSSWSALPVLELMDMCLQVVLPTGYASQADLKIHYVAEGALELLILLFK